METLLLIVLSVLFIAVLLQVVSFFVMNRRLSNRLYKSRRLNTDRDLYHFVARLVDIMYKRKSQAKDRMREEFREKGWNAENVVFSFFPGIDSAVENFSKRDWESDIRRIPDEKWIQINNTIIKPLGQILPPDSFNQIRIREKDRLHKAMHTAIAEVEKKYRFFNFSPMTSSLIRKICDEENIDIIYDFELDGLYSALAVYKQDDETRGTIFIRPHLHPCQIMFLTLYELGHWFLHAKNKAVYSGDDISSLLEKSARDIEATHFALIALFPTPWIYFEANYRSPKEEIEELLMRYFNRHYGVFAEIQNRNQKLSNEVKKNIELRAESYRFYQANHLQMLLQFLPQYKTLSPEQLDFMKHSYQDHVSFACATTDLNARVNWCSDRFLKLINLKKEDVIGKPLEDLIVSESRSDFNLQMELRKRGEPGTYAAKFVSGDTEGYEIVWIIGWPVVYPKTTPSVEPRDEQTLTFGLIIPRDTLGDLRVHSGTVDLRKQ